MDKETDAEDADRDTVGDLDDGSDPESVSVSDGI